MLLEVIAISERDVKDAVRCGADRIELVTGIAEGGLTPSLGLIEAAVEATDKPVNVMLRPHSQSFCYDDGDRTTLLRDLRHIRRTAAAGVVFGALTAEGKVDTALLRAVLEEAEHLDVTFHRAFDECADRLEALYTLADYPQVSRVLTSGGPNPAPMAVPEIRRLTEAAAGRNIAILGGHGLTPDNVGAFIRAAGVKEVHFGSAVRAGGSFARPIDPERMAKARAAVDAARAGQG